MWMAAVVFSFPPRDCEEQDGQLHSSCQPCVQAGPLTVVVAVFGPLTGQQSEQAVPRAEIVAMTIALRLVCAKSWYDVSIYSDHKAVVDVVARSSSPVNSDNNFLWKTMLSDAEAAKVFRVAVRKVPSHVDQDITKL